MEAAVERGVGQRSGRGWRRRQRRLGPHRLGSRSANTSPVSTTFQLAYIRLDTSKWNSQINKSTGLMDVYRLDSSCNTTREKDGEKVTFTLTERRGGSYGTENR